MSLSSLAGHVAWDVGRDALSLQRREAETVGPGNNRRSRHSCRRTVEADLDQCCAHFYTWLGPGPERNGLWEN